MKPITRKLSLNRETIRNLQERDLRFVGGGRGPWGQPQTEEDTVEEVTEDVDVSGGWCEYPRRGWRNVMSGHLGCTESTPGHLC